MRPVSGLNPLLVFKKTLIIFIPVMLLACIIAVFILHASNTAENEFVQSQQRHAVALRVAGINRDIAEISTVLSTLSNSQNVEHLWDFSGNPIPFVIDRLTQDFINVARYHKKFDQVRLINESGRETIRVNYKDGRVYVVAEDRLQNKKGRYYFDDAIRLDRGQIFVSPLDLNVENGQVEIPYKPMIRFATPVFDQQGYKRGIILLNYFGSHLIARFSEQFLSELRGQAMILNPDGYWLKSPVTEDEWGFMFDDRKHLTFGTRFTNEWGMLKASSSGQFETDAGLFTFETVYPLKQGQLTSVLVSTDGPSGSFSTDHYFWKIISHIPADDLTAYSDQRLNLSLWVLSLMALVVFPASWWMSRSSLKEKVAEKERLLHSTALDSTNNSVLITDSDGHIEWANQSLVRQSGKTIEQLASLTLLDLLDDQPGRLSSLTRAIDEQTDWQGELIYQQPDGGHYPADTTLTPVSYDEDDGVHFIAIIRDLSEKKALETQLLAAQKMESIGQLAAGIAHEINTPTQFVGDNISFLKDVIDDYMSLLDYLQQQTGAEKADMESFSTALREKLEHIDVDFIRQEAPSAVRQSQEGLERISKIVSAMKDFSHPGDSGKSEVDLNRIIETTVTIARNEWKYVAVLETRLDSELPTIHVDSQLIGQTILNLIVNAAHAIGEKFDGQQVKGLITISTRHDDAFVEMTLTDNGIGIPESLLHRIFEPFFTTKDVGKGSGQGLAIAYSGIVEKHQGDIQVQSTVGEGTTFTIKLPISSGSQSLE